MEVQGQDTKRRKCSVGIFEGRRKRLDGVSSYDVDDAASSACGVSCDETVVSVETSTSKKKHKHATSASSDSIKS